MGKLTECSACKKEISINAKTCPHCGEPSLAEKFNRAGNKIIQTGVSLIILGAILIAMFLFVTGGL